MTLYWYADVTRRTCTGMAEHSAPVMFTVFVFRLVAVLSTGVRKNERVVRWLFEASTVALIPGKCVLGVSVVTVWTSPAVECKKLFGSFLCISSHGVIVPVVIVVV